MNESGYYLTLTEVTQSTHVSVETVVTIVEQGIVRPRGGRPTEWQFEPPMVATLQRACRLQRDLELDWAGVALALELLEELEQLRADNQRLRRQLACLLEE
jgi:chaperone modulatory protein CbpM